jgi:hypothetical protein
MRGVAMTKTRSVLMACGLAGVLGLGALAIGRAQQAEPKGETGVSPRKTLRDRVVTLRTEIDLLQLECDGIRAALLKTLEGVEQGDILGIDVSSLMGSAKLELGGISGNAESLKEMSDLMKAMDSPNKDDALSAMKKASGKYKADFRASLDRKKQEYVRKLRALHEKKLDLEESENRYRVVR